MDFFFRLFVLLPTISTDIFLTNKRVCLELEEIMLRLPVGEIVAFSLSELHRVLFFYCSVAK
jgi:hypothetical protein